MSEKLKEHLTRQGVAKLQPLLGNQIVDLLIHVGQEALAPQVLAELIIMSMGPASILKDDVTRQMLLDHLHDDDVRNLCNILSIPSDIPRTSLNGVNFQRPTAALKLFEWYGVAYPEDGGQRDELSRNISSQEKLGFFQKPAYRQLRRVLENEGSKVLVHMPFGAGKLRAVITAVLEAFRSDSEDKTVLWLASDTCLCEEAFREIETVWNQFGLRDVTAYRLYGGRKISPLDSVSNALVVADIKSLEGAFMTWARNGVNVDESLASFGRRLRCLVLADAEHIVLPEIKRIISKMSSAGGKFNIVGISATPGPATEANTPIKVTFDAFNGVVVEIDDIDPLSALRLSCGIDPINLFRVPSPIKELSDVDDPISLPEVVANYLASNVDRNKFLLDKLLDISKEEDRIVFYATTALQARMFAGLLGLKGTPAAAVTGEMPPERRIQEMARFEGDHQKQVLCIHGALVSSSSVQGITAVVIALPTTSGALLHEMVGRLVTFRGIPQKPLKVYAVQDPVPGYLRLVENLDRWDRMRP
ncbi:DEAD/DEAH box helicase [Undibacterium sp. TJN25]|uniref:DEAD/DEAH box helicase n=1 Tax=Undibacterium sp. TJN25 TaxID=3413056 RepID=UPI003BF27264